MPAPDYDVAISFLRDPDLARAQQLAEVLGTRYRVFVYKGEQPHLVGPKGLDTFAAVFHDLTRLAVVLHRQGWGDKGMTQAERNAMIKRRDTGGEDFLLIVSMDGSKPLWVSDDNIYLDFEEYGFDTLVETVEVRLDKLGARKPSETTPERLRRQAIKRADELRRDAYRDTKPSAGFFRDEWHRLPQVVRELVERFNLDIPDTYGTVEVERDWVFVRVYQFGLTFNHMPRTSDRARGSYLRVFEKKRKEDRPPSEWGSPTNEKTYEVVLGIDDAPKWRREGTSQELELEDLLSERILGIIEKAHLERDREARKR